MARIFSWKITNGKYAYLVKDEVHNTYIRNRVSDAATLLQFSKTILGFTENEYMSEYMNLRNEVLSLYGKDIGDDYSVYYDTGEDGGENKLILLSGKDGENASVAKTTNNSLVTKNDYQAIKEIVNNSIDEFKEKENLLSNSVKEYIDTTIGLTFDSAMCGVNEAKEQIGILQAEVQNVASNDANVINALKTFTGSTSENINSLMTQTGQMDNWIKDYGDALSGIVVDYNGAKAAISSMAGQDPSNGLFSNMSTCFTNMNGKINNVETKCYELSGTVENIAKREPIDIGSLEEGPILSKSMYFSGQDDEDTIQTLSDKNGIVFMYKDDSFISFVDGDIILQSGDYGLKITNEGIKVRKKGGDYTDAKF